MEGYPVCLLQIAHKEESPAYALLWLAPILLSFGLVALRLSSEVGTIHNLDYRIAVDTRCSVTIQAVYSSKISDQTPGSSASMALSPLTSSST